MAKYVLEKDIEIFKRLIRFFHKNNKLKFYNNEFKVHLMFLLYKAIFKIDFSAVKFLVEETDVDLLMPSQGFKQKFALPVIGADDDNETFKFLLLHTLQVWQDKNEGEDSSLLEKVKNALVEVRKARVLQTSLEGCSQKSLARLLNNIEAIDRNLKAIECYQMIKDIFVQKSVNSIYQNLSKSYPLDNCYTMGKLLEYFCNFIKK